MESIVQQLPQLLAYQPAFTALAILCLAILVQSFLAGALGLGKSDEIPGVPLKGTHGDSHFRILRTYANSTENFSVMFAVTLLAILAGIGPFWVNWLVGLHVLIRMLYWLVYYAGIGKVAAGPRTIIYVLGWLMNFILAILAVYAMLT